MLSQLSLSICISQFNHMQCKWHHLEAKFAACVDILAVLPVPADQAVWCVLSCQTRRCLFLGHQWVYKRSDCCSSIVVVQAPRTLELSWHCSSSYFVYNSNTYSSPIIYSAIFIQLSHLPSFVSLFLKLKKLSQIHVRGTTCLENVKVVCTLVMLILRNECTKENKRSVKY